MPGRPALPISLNLDGRRCLVVGDPASSAARAAQLARAGAAIDVVAPALYEPARARDAFMVLCLDAALAAAVSRDARAAGALFYATDRPELSDFAMPALARRGAITLAASTDGLAPALARRLREELERLLATGGAELDALVDEMARLRAALPPGQRRERLSAEAARLDIDGRIRVRVS